MVKKRGKRKAVEREVSLLSNLTGLESGYDDSLESCMAELQQRSHAEPAMASPKKAKLTDDERIKLPIILNKSISSERVEAWNREFKEWATHGTYTPELLPSIDEAVQRNFKVEELSKYLLEAGGKEVRMPVFERWWIDSKYEEQQLSSSSPIHDDLIVPSKPTPSSEASQRLIDELLQHDKTRKEAERIVQELCRKTNVVAQELSSQQQHWNSQTPLKKGDRISLEDHETSWTLKFSRKKWKKPFCVRLNKSHYDKLRNRFVEIHGIGRDSIDISGTSKASKRALNGYHIIVFTLLLRYSSLSGGQLLQDLRGGGMQGAIHEEVFDAIKSYFPDQDSLEGFASPFNSCLPNFASAFPDLEWHFGSVGSFMECSFGEGYCEANPPFSPALMDGMVDHMENQLQLAEKDDRSLSFIVIVPTGGRSSSGVAAAKNAAGSSFSRLTSSTFLREHLRLPAREHGYIEAAQHLRPTKYKQSTYDTSIIILRSQNAKDLDMDSRQLRNDVKTAFSSRHEIEMKERKLTKS